MDRYAYRQRLTACRDQLRGRASDHFAPELVAQLADDLLAELAAIEGATDTSAADAQARALFDVMVAGTAGERPRAPSLAAGKEPTAGELARLTEDLRIKSAVAYLADLEVLKRRGIVTSYTISGEILAGTIEAAITWNRRAPEPAKPPRLRRPR